MLNSTSNPGLNSQTPGILLRCDASKVIGLGHVVRCLALAEALAQLGARVQFAMIEGELTQEMVRAKGYAIELKPADVEAETWLESLLTGHDAVVFDVRDDTPSAWLKQIRRSGRLVVTIDDISERSLAADLVVFPPVPQVDRLAWQGFSGKRLIGWPWVVLRSMFANLPYPVNQSPPHILVTLGGSDAWKAMKKVLRALNQVRPEIHIDLVVGAAMAETKELPQLCNTLVHGVTIYRNVSDMAGVMHKATLAVCAFGMTAYELAAVGVPAVHLAWTDDHAESASLFATAGIAINLGCVDDFDAEQLVSAVDGLIQDDTKRTAMMNRGRSLVDGKGAQRVAGEIVNAIAIQRRVHESGMERA